MLRARRFASISSSISSVSNRCVCRSLSTQTPAETTQRIKAKPPLKRASSLLNELRQDELAKCIQTNKDKGIPDFRVGDALEVKMVMNLAAKDVETHRGVVISKTNRGPDTWMAMIDVVLGLPIKYEIPLYSPFIKSIKVLQPAYIHKGKKRVRRSKLHYLWEKRDPKEFTISG